MFRSLFIGFLIFSALTSKGAVVQINQDINNISADMLLEFFNAALTHADKQAELTFARPDGVLFSDNSGDRAAIEKLLRLISHDNPVVWADSISEYGYSDLQYSNVSLMQKQPCRCGAFSCASDTSPPNFQ